VRHIVFGAEGRGVLGHPVGGCPRMLDGAADGRGLQRFQEAGRVAAPEDAAIEQLLAHEIGEHQPTP
jgi:hypothetical protein